MLWYRLHNDFHLAIMTLFGACATLGILPFAVYRFISGNILAGVLDCAIVLTIIAAVVYAWWSDQTRGAAWFVVVTTTAGCIAVATLFGLPGLFWLYAVVLSNFMLLRPKEAVMVTCLALAVLAIHGKAFDSVLQLSMFAVSVSVVSLFAFIFAYRAELQRRQLQTLASHDPLTGAANRRSMEEELQVAIEMSRRERLPCGLAMLDLDHFKRINDHHGHAAGDQVLIDVVDLIRASTRKIDRLFRFGGEEFVLLLPGADAAALHTIIENLRMRIGESLQSRGEAITVSIGAAALRPHEQWEAWLARADVALYQAKHAGRNRGMVACDVRRIPAYVGRDKTVRRAEEVAVA